MQTRLPLSILSFVLASWTLTGTALAQPAPAPAPPPPGWTGSAGAGLALTSGNSDTSSVNAAYELKRDAGGNLIFKSAGLFLYGKAEETVTSDRLSLDGRFERKLNELTALFGQVQYLRDEFKSIDYLVSPTVGLTRTLVKNDRTDLNVDGSVGMVWEQNPGLELQTDGAVGAGQKFTHKITATTELTQKTAALWKMDDFADGLYTLGVGLAASITGGTQMKIEVLDTYKSRPPLPEVQENDIATLVSFIYKFE